MYTNHFTRTLFASLFLSLAAITGCSAGSSSAPTTTATPTAPAPTPPAPTPPTTTTANGDFTVTTGPTGSVEVAPTVSGTYSPVPVTLTVAGTDSLNSVVSVTESELPAGITASAPNFQFMVQPSVNTPTQTVMFTVAGSVSAGSYPVTFTASANGSIHTTVFNLIVPGISSAPDFSFTVSPSAASIPFGTGPGIPFGVSSTYGNTTINPGAVPLSIAVTGQNGFSDCVTVVGSDSAGGPDILRSQGIPGALALMPGIPQTVYVRGTFTMALTGYTESQPGTYTATFTAYDNGPGILGCGTNPISNPAINPSTLSHVATVSITIAPVSTLPDSRGGK
jgi:hypothetical protein